MLNKEQIKEIIPQRESFLMIDEVEEYIPGKSCIAYKNVDKSEWYFKGHFPGNPIMPGVLITESLAQAGAVAILSLEENKGKKQRIIHHCQGFSVNDQKNRRNNDKSHPIGYPSEHDNYGKSKKRKVKHRLFRV